jgi:hypothetical protein
MLIAANHEQEVNKLKTSSTKPLAKVATNVFGMGYRAQEGSVQVVGLPK